jgi:hypothetical protein
MAFRRNGVSMGPASDDEYSLRTTEESLVARIVSALLE